MQGLDEKKSHFVAIFQGLAFSCQIFSGFVMT